MESAKTRPGVSNLLPLLAVGWVGVLALVYLSRYEGWLLPLQFAALLRAFLPSCGVGPHFGRYLLDSIVAFVCVGAILATAFALGATLFRNLLPRAGLLDALLALALGLWVIAAVVLAVGVVSTKLVPCVFAGALTWFARGPREMLSSLRGSGEKLDAWSRWMLAAIVVAAVLMLPGVLVPPFEYDEMEYHLGALAEYQRAGRIVFLPHNFYSNMPQLTEMLFLLATVSASDIAAKLLHWVFGLAAAAGVYAIGARWWSRRVGLTAAAIFYCTPLVRELSQTARVDLATTFFAVLAFGCLVIWLDRQDDDALLWLSALAAGMAVATKWTAVSVVALPALLFVAGRTRSFRMAGGYLLLVVVPVLPWMMKSWLLAGNPVYPLFWKFFGSPYWSQAQAELFAQKHYATFDAMGLSALWSKLWDYSFTEPGAVPLLLMVAPLVLLVRGADRAARRCGWLFVAGYACWFLLTYRPWRFLFPVLPLAALAGAYALSRLEQSVLRVAVGVTMGLSVLTIGMLALVDSEMITRVPTQVTFLHYALGQLSREEFVSRMGGGMFEPQVWMNEHLPRDSTVLYLGEARPYYAQQRLVWATAYDQHPLSKLAAGVADPADLAARMRGQGIGYVYVNFSELERLQRSYNYLSDVDWPVVQNFLEQFSREIHRTNRGVVYELSR